jgi:hypothetical protein
VPEQNPTIAARPRAGLWLDLGLVTVQRKDKPSWLSRRVGLWLDLGLVTALLVLAALPLIVLRDLTRREAPPLAGVCCALGGGLVALWLAAARWLGRTAPPQAPSRPGPAGAPALWGRVEFTAAGVLLLALTLVTFYRPMLKQFWTGHDDLMNLDPVMSAAWCTAADAGGNRPLTFTLAALSRALLPGRIEAFLWLAVTLWWANALLLFAILRCLFPRASAVPWLAAAFLVLSHGDPFRYMVMFATNYYQTGLFFFQSGLWLFLVSSRRQSRALLLASCLCLGATLLASESFFPLALLAPVLLWRTGRRGRALGVWSYFWIGTMALLAVRLCAFLLAPLPSATYQENLARAALRDPHVLWDRFVTRVAAILTYFRLTGPLGPYRGPCLLAASLAVGLAWLATRQARAAGASRRRLAAGAGLAALACVLGTLPFLPLHTVARALFLAAPAQAALLACCLCLAVSFLPRPAGRLAVAACLGYVAAVAAAESHREQDRECPDRFANLAHLLDQLPRVSPDTLILLVPAKDEDVPRCVLQNHTLSESARLSFGTAVYLANFQDPYGYQVTFTRDGVAAQNPKRGLGAWRYEQVVAFRLGTDWGLTLLRHLPPGLLPEGSRAEGYDPLARIVPGPVPPPPYFRPPAGADRLRDLFDREDGLLLGEHWARLETDDGHLCRFAEDGAELVVNPLGQESRQLRLELAPGPRYAGTPCLLEAVDEAGRVVASATLLGRQEVLLTVPTCPARLSVLRLQVREGTAAGDHPFRAFRPGGRVSDCRPPAEPADIAGDSLRLGKNWLGPEPDDRGKRFRWARTDAEVQPGVFHGPGEELVLDLEPNPVLGGRPCRLQVLDESGRVLAQASVRGREEVRAALPAETRAASVFRLHVEGGDSPVPIDPKELYFRVYSCRCLPCCPAAAAAAARGRRGTAAAAQQPVAGPWNLFLPRLLFPGPA